MAPAERGFVFLGKALASLALLGVVQLRPPSSSRSPSRLPGAARRCRSRGGGRSGPLGLCPMGTLFAAVAVRTRYREVMLPLLLLPLLVPLMLGAVWATEAALAQQPIPWPPLQLLLVTDAVFLIVSFVCFEYVLDE